MKIHEYQAKKVLAGYGVAVPRGIPVETPEAAAVEAAEYEPEPDAEDRPSIPMGAFAVDNDDVGWFSLAVEPSAEPPPVGAEPAASVERVVAADAPFVPSEPPLRVAGSDPHMPLSDKATPGDWQAGPLFAFGGGEHSTLPGVGNLPRAGELPPIPFAPEPEADAEPILPSEVASAPPPAVAPEPEVAASPALEAAAAPAPETSPPAPADDSPDLEVRAHPRVQRLGGDQGGARRGRADDRRVADRGRP